MARFSLGLQTLALLAGAVLPACASQTPGQLPRNTGMGIDAFGHTQLSEARSTVAPGGFAHLQRLIASLRSTLPKYRNIERAVADGFRPEGPDVPVGSLKHFVSYANVRVNWQHLDPERPMALLYRRTQSGYELAGVMFTAPITSTMDELDRRIPLAYGHWHSHRNVCQPKDSTATLTDEQRHEFGFSGSINTKADCDAAGGVFMDNVFGWMVHVYPFEDDPAKQF
jgi:hypothetical protein